MKNGWKIVRLGSVASVDRRSVDSSAISDGTTYVGLENIESGGEFVGVKAVANGDLASNKFAFTDRHILYGKLRPYLAKIAMPNFSGVCSTDILPISVGPQIVREYLVQYLRQPAVIDLANSKASGANLPRLSPNALTEFEVPLPSLPEQRQIADILDRAEALRAKRRASLALLDSLTQSIFIEMFGDPIDILKRWSVKKLGALLDFLTSGSRGWAEHYSEHGDLFLRIQNIRNDQLTLDDVAYVNAPDTAEAKRTRVRPGDVLLSITADLGRTAVVPDNLGAAYISQHLSILRTSSVVPRFLSAYLTSPAGRQQVLGRNRHGVKAGLNFDDIRAFLVPTPPIEMQHDFVRRIMAVEKLEGVHRSSLVQLDALFASLQHRAFRGEL